MFIYPGVKQVIIHYREHMSVSGLRNGLLMYIKGKIVCLSVCVGLRVNVGSLKKKKKKRQQRIRQTVLWGVLLSHNSSGALGV